MDTKYIIKQLRKRAAWEKDAKEAAEKRGDTVESAWHDGQVEALLKVASEIEKGIF